MAREVWGRASESASPASRPGKPSEAPSFEKHRRRESYCGAGAHEVGLRDGPVSMGGWASSSGRWQTGLLRVTPSVPCAEPRSIPSGAPQGRKSRSLRAGERRVGIGAAGLPGLRQHGPRRPCLGVPAGRARHLASVCKRPGAVSVCFIPTTNEAEHVLLRSPGAWLSPREGDLLAP